MSLGAVLAVGLVYAVLATQLLGMAWPLPPVLPDTLSFRGGSFQKRDSAGCRSLPEWSRIQRTPISAYRSVGHLASAVYFFGPPVLTQLRPDPTYHQYQWFLAKRGDCYAYYQD
jgi:hypothetical protein